MNKDAKHYWSMFYSQISHMTPRNHMATARATPQSATSICRLNRVRIVIMDSRPVIGMSLPNPSVPNRHRPVSSMGIGAALQHLYSERNNFCKKERGKLRVSGANGTGKQFTLFCLASLHEPQACGDTSAQNALTE